MNRHQVDSLLFNKVAKVVASSCKTTSWWRFVKSLNSCFVSSVSKTTIKQLLICLFSEGQLGRSHFFSYVTICSYIGNKKIFKKQFKNAYTCKLLHTTPLILAYNMYAVAPWRPWRGLSKLWPYLLTQDSVVEWYCVKLDIWSWRCWDLFCQPGHLSLKYCRKILWVLCPFAWCTSFPTKRAKAMARYLSMLSSMNWYCWPWALERLLPCLSWRAQTGTLVVTLLLHYWNFHYHLDIS